MDKLLYAIARFDSATETKLKEAYNTLKRTGFNGKQTLNIPYHITLASFDPARESEIQQRLENVSAAAKRFRLKFNHFGLFGLNVLFYAPDVNAQLLELYRIVSGDEDYSNDWTAHTTVLIDEPETVLRALPIVSRHLNCFEAQVENISLYEFWPTRMISDYNLQ